MNVGNRIVIPSKSSPDDTYIVLRVLKTKLSPFCYVAPYSQVTVQAPPLPFEWRLQQKVGYTLPKLTAAQRRALPSEFEWQEHVRSKYGETVQSLLSFFDTSKQPEVDKGSENEEEEGALLANPQAGSGDDEDDLDDDDDEMWRAMQVASNGRNSNQIVSEFLESLNGEESSQRGAVQSVVDVNVVIVS